MMKIALAGAALICGAMIAGAALAEGETVPPAAGPTPLPDTPACAPANRIQSWSLIDERHVYLTMQDRRRRFLVTFLGPCKEAKWATIMELRRGGPGKCLWAGDQLNFRRTPFEGGDLCWIDTIEPAPPVVPAERPARKVEPERPMTF